jgi:hypothetical protein
MTLVEEPKIPLEEGEGREGFLEDVGTFGWGDES